MQIIINKHDFLPFTYDDCVPCKDDISYYDVEFTEDFGKITKGRKFGLLYVTNNTLIAYFNERDRLFQKFKAIPIEEK